jgi:hypothetical protein
MRGTAAGRDDKKEMQRMKNEKSKKERGKRQTQHRMRRSETIVAYLPVPN